MKRHNFLNIITTAFLISATMFTNTYAMQQNVIIPVAESYVDADNSIYSDMVYDLYKNEDSQSIKNMCIDLLLTLTGERKPVRIYSNGLTEIGTYNRDFNFDFDTVLHLITKNKVTYTYTDSTITLYLSPEDKLNEALINEYRERLTYIYSVVNNVKNATSNMSVTDKAGYINDYVSSLMVYDSNNIPKSVYDAIINGRGACFNYANLVYILGINCGINVDIKVGSYNGIGHAWNEFIAEDGNAYVIDAAGEDGNNIPRGWFKRSVSDYYAETGMILKTDSLR